MSEASPLPPLTAAQQELSEALRRHVRRLAADIGPRSVFLYDSLVAAQEYISSCWEEMGYAVERLPYEVSVGEHKLPVSNLAVEVPGAPKNAPLLTIGAHYDSVGYSCPGANDNASGIAALLEMARSMKSGHPSLKIRFAAFVNEEPPFFLTEEMGSMVYAAQEKDRAAAVRGMISLETIGYYCDSEGSQCYPQPLALSYPKKGNFIAFVSNLESAGFLSEVLDLFRKAADFPAEGLSAPQTIPGTDWSDHAAFWVHGYPALMVTDTALFRYPHYHEETDTYDKLDYDRMARVVEGLCAVLRALKPAKGTAKRGRHT